MKRIVIGIVVVVILLPIVGLATLSLLARRPTNLGVVEGKLAPCPDTPNCVGTQATDAEHHAEPIPFAGDRATSLARMKRVLAALPRCRIVTATDDYLHAECTSLLFRFVDDVEFYFDDTDQTIQFRSASRVGRSDLGVNRARMEAIRAEFQSGPGVAQ